MAIEIDRRGVSRAARRREGRIARARSGIRSRSTFFLGHRMSEPSYCSGGGGYFANHDRSTTSHDASRGVRARRSRAAGGVGGACARAQTVRRGTRVATRARGAAGRDWRRWVDGRATRAGRARISITRVLKRACIRRDRARRCGLDAACALI